MDYFLAQVTNGLAAGSIYGLLAIGYSMVFGIMNQINYAHGDLYMFGTFVAMSLILAGLHPLLAIPVAMMVGGVFGVIIERVAYRPVRDANWLVPTVSAIGVALILRGAAQTIWGTAIRPFPITLSAPVFEIAGIEVHSTQFVVFGLGVLLMIVFTMFIRRVKAGKGIRAVAQDMGAAAMMGVPVNRVIMMVYGLGAVLGVASGILFSSYYNIVYISMGFAGTLKAFTATVIGGIGNLHGAFIGGLLLGMVEMLAAGYISSAARDTVAFVLLILFLLFRPTGLFGVRVSQKA